MYFFGRQRHPANTDRASLLLCLERMVSDLILPEYICDEFHCTCVG